MPKPILTLTLLLTLALSTLAPSQTQAQTSLLQLTPNEHAAAIRQALEANQPDQAYLHARAWKRSAPNQIPPLTALVSAYLAFNAPAAALETIETALLFAPDPAETRRLQALKIQTLAELGDLNAAWANARSYLRHADPSDPFAAIISQLQWSTFSSYASTLPYAAHLDRISTRDETSSPLTSAYIQENWKALTEKHYRAWNAANQSENPDDLAEASRQITRYLLAAHYVSDPQSPNSTLTPIYKYPDSFSILNQLTWDDSPDPIALSLKQWAPQYTMQADTYHEDDYEPEVPDESPEPQIIAFLKTTTAKLNDLEKDLPVLLAKADIARSSSEIGDALRELILLQNHTLAKIQSLLNYYTDILRVWQQSQNETNTDLAEQLAQLQDTLQNAPFIEKIQNRLNPALPYNLPEAEVVALSLPHRLAMLILAEADADWAAPLDEIQKLDTPTIEDFDTLIARDLMTPQLWARRLAAAERLEDWSEIAWSGFETYAQDPQALANFLSPLIAANDSLIGQALTTLASGTDEEKSLALTQLETGLQRDPGHLAGLQALYQIFLNRQLDSYAAPILESLWRLSPSDFDIDDEALALAARSGRWQLLLSLTDYRLSISDTDTTAHLHRQIAAVALGFASLAAESTPALDGTVYTHQSRVLQSLAYSMKDQKYERFTDPTTGLSTSFTQLNNDHDDPIVRLWLALGLRLKNHVFQNKDFNWESIAVNATPEMKSHLDFIRGTTDAQTYLAASRNTPEEGTALFLHQFILNETSSTPQSQSGFAALANRQDVPLFFRAKAAAALSSIQSLPLRPSDPYYTAFGTKNWEPIWATLAPGQKLIALSEVRLPNAENTLPILRLSRPARNPLVTLANTQNYQSRLWELDGVQITGLNRFFTKWEIPSGSVAALAHSNVIHRIFQGNGSLWLEDSDIEVSSGTLAQLFQNNVQTTRSDLHITQNWEANQLRSDDSVYQIGLPESDKPNTYARIQNSLFLNHQSPPFVPSPNTTFQISDTRFYTQQPLGLTQNQTSFRNSRITGAAQLGLANATGLEITPLKLDGPADRIVSTYAELQQALAAALPGQRIEVAPGKILFDKPNPIQVPRGVVLRGSSDSSHPTVLVVKPTSSASPLLIVNSGDSWIEKLTFDVEESFEIFNGRQVGLADRLSSRQALVAKPGSRSLLRNIRFAGWNKQSADRPAIVADNAQLTLEDTGASSIQLTQGSRIDHLGYISYIGTHLSGTGEAYFSPAAPSAFTISGQNIKFYGAPRTPSSLVYEKGAGDPRTLAWRSLARQNLMDTLAQMQTQLSIQLDAASSTDERINLFRAAAKRLGPLVRAAQLNPQEAAQAIAEHLNSAMMSRPDEFPFYVEVFHFRTLAFPNIGWLYNAHSQTFSPAYRARLKAHLDALVGTRYRTPGELSSSDRITLITFMKRHPVGSRYHARALEAFKRGEFPSTFETQIQQEARYEQLRIEEEAKMQKLRQAEYERQRQAALNPPPPAKKSWWERSGSSYPSSRYNSSSSSYSGSSTQQMLNFRNQLNKNIYNAGRDYGKQRAY